MKVATTIQMQRSENAAATLCTMLGHFGLHVSLEEVRGVCPASRNGTAPKSFAKYAEAYGLCAHVHEADVGELRGLEMPVVVSWKRRSYVVLKGFRHGRVSVSDSAKGEYDITEDKFANEYGGTVIELSPGPAFQKGGRPTTLLSLILHRLACVRGDLAKLLVLNVLAVLFNLAYVQGMRQLLNEDVFAERTTFALWGALLAEAVLLALYTAAAIRKTLLIDDVSRRAAATSGARMFKHLFRLPMEFFDHTSAGELLQRMENNTSLDRSLIQTLVPRVIDVVMLVAYLLLMYSYNVWVATICLAVEIAYVVTVHLQSNAVTLRSRSMVSSSGSLSSSVLNGLGTIDTIKSGGTERVFFNMWKESQEEYQDDSRASLKVNATSQVISSAHSTFSHAALLFAGAHFMMQGSFDTAALAAMQMVVGRVGSSLSSCVSTITNLQSTRTKIERVEDIERREAVPEVPLGEGEEPEKLSGELVVDHVSFRYNPADAPAVDDVSLTMRPGEMYAIVGRTGCGKSTLLKLIADLYTPTSGDILYAGRRRGEIPDVVFRSSVVTVDQEAMMFEDSIRANLRMWDTTIEDYAMVLAAREAQIHDRIIRGEHGYDTVMRENGRGFSGGELQRLELARALEKEPTLLLLDEFTSSLDTLTEEKVMRAIRLSDATCVIVAHRLSTIRDADQIVVMDAGRIVAQGTHDELMAQGGLYCDLVANE